MTIAHDRSIPLLATNDAHFPYKEWAETQRVAKMPGPTPPSRRSPRRSIKGKATYLGELHPTLYLASETRCASGSRTTTPTIPDNVTDEAMDNTAALHEQDHAVHARQDQQAAQGPRRRHVGSREVLREWIDEGWERIQREYPSPSTGTGGPSRATWSASSTEWTVLKNKGVIDYFVLVGDMVRWAKSQRHSRRVWVVVSPLAA